MGNIHPHKGNFLRMYEHATSVRGKYESKQQMPLAEVVKG